MQRLPKKPGSGLRFLNLSLGNPAFEIRLRAPVIFQEKTSSNCQHNRSKKGAKRLRPSALIFRLRAPAGGGRRPQGDQRLENWNDLRALARPYFLRSTVRESRVRKPPFFKTLRRSGSKLVSALEMP
jgi:hypothetical protein